MKRRRLIIILIAIITGTLTALHAYLEHMADKTPLPPIIKPYLSSVWPVIFVVNAIVAGLTEAQKALEQKDIDHPASAQESQYRQRMLEKVRAFWITGVLEHSLHHSALITLGLNEQQDAIANPWHLVIQQPDQPESPLLPGTSIIEVYKDAGGELLILGEPGSGKTTLLLELTRNLLDHAEQDDKLQMPVVFNLSSWATKQHSLAQWLVEELMAKYQVSRKLGQAWVNNDQIVPLLDGLDEVTADARAACVDAINTYRQEHMVPTVVCSRRTEYLTQTKRVALRKAVVVQPLTVEQIDAYLSSAGSQLAAVRAALNKDKILQELATTPLMLNILILTYRDVPLDQITEGGSSEAPQKQLLASYVPHMLKRRGAETRYTPEQTIQWLSWLARQMALRNQTTFFIERLQPDWLPARWIHWVYRVSIGSLVGLLCLFIALLAGLIFGTSSVGQPIGLLVGLVAGFLIGLVSGFLSGLRREITPAEQVAWSWKKALWGYGGTGLVVGWPLLLPFFLRANPPSVNSSSSVDSSSSISIIISLFLWLLSPLLIGLINGLRIKIKPFRVAWSWKRVLWGYGGCWLFFFWIILLLMILLSPFSSLPSLLLLPLLLIGLINGLRIKIKPFRVAWSWKRALRSELVIVCLPALFAALFGGPLVGLFFGLSGNTLEEHIFMKPNGGIWRSARNSIRYGAIVALILVSVLLIITLMVASIGAPEPKWWFLGEQWISDLLLSLPFVLPVIVLIVLIIGLIAGGLACIQHITLRVFLQRKGSAPWNYPRFLDYATERILLRKVGGGYIFMHRLLLDYFASLEKKAS